jgi:hypothetical protein
MRGLGRRLVAQDQYVTASAQLTNPLEIGSGNPGVSENRVTMGTRVRISIITGFNQCLVDGGSHAWSGEKNG